MENEEIDYSRYQNLGRLHLVKKCKKEFSCRECAKNILPGSICYTQSVKPLTGRGFPMPSRVCFECGQFMHEKVGFEIVEGHKKEVAK